MEMGYAIVRPNGAIQKTRTILEGVQFEIYASSVEAEFIRDKAYPGFRVVPVKLSL